MDIGDVVKWNDDDDALPAYRAMRGEVQETGPYKVKVLWDCDKEAGFRDGTWTDPRRIEVCS